MRRGGGDGGALAAAARARPTARAQKKHEAPDLVR